MIRILDLNRGNMWQQLLDKLPEDQQDIYFTPDYYKLYEKKEAVKPLCFVFEKNDDIAIYPFLLKSINKLDLKDLEKEYFDIQGTYGYNGVASSNYSEKFISEFEKAFKDFCYDYNIIAEFTRFNPIIKNHLFSKYLSPKRVNQNIVVDLTLNKKEIWLRSYEYSTRKNVKKALTNNLEVICLKGDNVDKKWLDVFINIYHKTMDRQSADKFYYFSKDFFEGIIKYLKNYSLFFFTIKDNISISTEVVLFYKEIGYSFLGGTLSEFFPLRPNDILKHNIILRLKEMGLKYFCLGGGDKINDGIFRYKKTFAKNGIYDFFIGKKVYKKNTYEKVCKAWEKKFPNKKEKYKNMLLKYRY